jgi:PEP-CTERM motif
MFAPFDPASTRIRLLASLAVGLIAGMASPAFADSFPAAPENLATTSLGKFSITVAQPFWTLIAADTPAGFNYNPITHVLTSPLLYDSNTTIGVSASIPAGVGSPAETAGVQVGPSPPMNIVTLGDYTNIPSAFTPTPTGTQTLGAPEVYTQVQLFNLTNGMGTSVLAGSSASSAPVAVPNSDGQVQAMTNMGDFPAQSFFDIFVDIQVPLPGMGTINLENVDNGPMGSNVPLVVEAMGVTTLPPMVLYTHSTSSSTVPIVIACPPASPPPCGEVFGTINLAAHGVGYTDTPADIMMFNQQFRELGGYVAPEPSTWAMMAIGFAGLGYAAYCRSKRRTPADILG